MEKQDTTEDSTPLIGIAKGNENADIKFPSCRHVLVFMAFLGFVNVYALRVNLSVAIVSMVNRTEPDKNHTMKDECPGQNDNKTSHDSQEGEFNWDANIQGLVLGSFFYGYIFTQIPGGWLAERYGGKKLFGFGVLCTSVFTLVTPIAARIHVNLLIATRIIEGLGEGVTFPAMHAMLSRWAPLYERSKLGTFAYAGAQFGTVISLPISGLLCKYGFAGGWPSVFYVFGACGVVWFIFWMLLIHDTPAQHPRISPAERSFIETSIGHSSDEKLPTAWGGIVTSIPVYAIIVAHFCNNWGFYTLLTTLPTYMKEVLHFDISQNGFLSALPYLAMWIMINAAGHVADFLRFRGIMSTTAVRKTFNTLGAIIPAIFLVVASYVGCNHVAAVAAVTMSVGFAGCALSGYQVNHLDIAPPFAGTLMGISNMFATIPGFAGPQVVGYFTADNPSASQWRIVFVISAAVYVFGAIVFLIFASGVEQPWARARPHADRITPPERHGEEEDDEILNFRRQTAVQ